MKLCNLSLLLLRLAISYAWLSVGLSKLFTPQFISTFGGTLETFAKNSPYPFYSQFLSNYVIHHSYVFGQLVIWGEVLAGVAFLLGFPIIMASFAGMFMNLNYFFVANSTPSQFLNIIMIFSQFVIWANGAGSICGLEAKFKK